MNAEIISVGTELLLGQILDTNAKYLSEHLAEWGIVCQRRTTIGDNLERLQSAISDALARSEIVFTIGGLGPTEDDLTRDGIAAAIGDLLVESPEVRATLIAFFESRNIPMVASNLRQALRPESARFIENPHGTAPGLICEKNQKIIIAMPGPPNEFEPMVAGPVRTYLQSVAGDGLGHPDASVIHSRTLRVIGIGESSAEAQIKHLMNSPNPTVAPYAKVGEVHLRISARAGSIGAANELINPVEAEIRSILGRAVYGVDEETLAEVTLQILRGRGQTLSTAESITGGMIGAELTSVAGSSEVYRGGAITYSVDTKVTELGIDRNLIAEFGPVSAEVARAMAQQTRGKLGTDWAIAVTGNAGPTVDIDGKEVGLVYIVLAGPQGVIVQEMRFRGGREAIRSRTVLSALAMLRDACLAEIP